MEAHMKQFWENGYTVFPSLVPASIIDQMLIDVSRLNYTPIFKQVFGEEYDDFRLQAPAPSKPAFKDLGLLIRREIIKKAPDMRWRAAQWVVLKSLPDGAEQEAHCDFPSFEISRARRKYNSTQASLMVGMMPATKLVVYEACFNQTDVTKRKVIEFGAGDCILIRGDLTHAGAAFNALNYRLHLVLTVRGIEWADNATEAAPVKIVKCEYCPLKFDTKLKLRNHSRFCASNPNKEAFLTKYNANNDKATIVTVLASTQSFPASSTQLEGKSWFTLNNTIELEASNDVSQPQRMTPALSEPSDEEKAVNSILRVRLHPTKPQTILLNKMFGTHRAIYNKLVDVSRDDCYKISQKKRAAKYCSISQKHSLANYLPEYHLNVPEAVMNSTYRDYDKAIKSSKALFFALKKENEKTSFPELKFKSKKANSSTIEIRARDIRESGFGYVQFFPKYFGFAKGEGIKVMQELPEFKLSLRLMRTRDAKFYLCIPRSREFEQTMSKRACAIDPGVCSFITMYDPEGVTLGVDDANDEIIRRCLMID